MPLFSNRDVNNLLPRLQRWYESQCDGDWEHDSGVKVQSLDNPGWMVKINLEGTPLEGRAFQTIERGAGYDATEDSEKPHADWLMCRVQNNTFEGAGGPRQLAEIIETFLNWAEQK
jgi:hypothetical protein